MELWDEPATGKTVGIKGFGLLFSLLWNERNMAHTLLILDLGFLLRKNNFENSLNLCLQSQ